MQRMEKIARQGRSLVRFPDSAEVTKCTGGVEVNKFPVDPRVSNLPSGVEIRNLTER